MSAAFFLAIEFQETGVLACLTNKAVFGDLPRNEQFELTGRRYNGISLSEHRGGKQLEANKQAYFAGWCRGDFAARYAGASNNQYVDLLIANTGVQFSLDERSALVNGLNGGSETRATVLRKVAEKQGFKQAQFNRIFVLMEYFGYLRRDPDTDGFNFWLNKLGSFNGNFVNAEMVRSFLASIEYRRRFSSL